MMFKPLAIVGFLLASLIGLSGAIDCPHAEAAMLASLVHAGHGEPQCHHNTKTRAHPSAAWIRPSQTSPAPAFFPAKGDHAIFVSASRAFPVSLLARDINNPNAIRDGTADPGLANIRTQRLLI